MLAFYLRFVCKCWSKLNSICSDSDFNTANVMKEKSISRWNMFLTALLKMEIS